MIANQNISMMSGNSCDVTVTVVDGAGAAYSFSGHTLVWKAMESNPGGTVKLTKSTAAGTLTATSLGIVTFTILPADTTLLAPGEYYHELVATKTSTSEVNTICYGYLSLLDSGVA